MTTAIARGSASPGHSVPPVTGMTRQIRASHRGYQRTPLMKHRRGWGRAQWASRASRPEDEGRMPDDRLDAPGDGRARAAAPTVGQSRPAGRVKARVHMPDAVLEQHPEAVGHLLEMLVGRWGLGVVEVERGVAQRQPVQDGQVMCTVRVAGYQVPVVLELEDVRLGSGDGSIRL